MLNYRLDCSRQYASEGCGLLVEDIEKRPRLDDIGAHDSAVRMHPKNG